MEDEIQRELDGISEAHGVAVLFAAESGSRAWGFASPDSDWDVRFIYARPLREYLTVSTPRDVIERTVGELDVSGWDIIKAMHLLRKSNSALIQWLGSPMIYMDRRGFADELRRLSRLHVSLKAAGHHYLSMAKTNYRSYIEGRDTVRLKKYLYAIRPVLCAKWAIENRTFPPTDFDEMLRNMEVPPTLHGPLDELLIAKRAAGEAEVGKRIRLMDAYIGNALSDWRGVVDQLPSPKFPAEPLNALLWQMLGLETTQPRRHDHARH